MLNKKKIEQLLSKRELDNNDKTIIRLSQLRRQFNAPDAKALIAKYGYKYFKKDVSDRINKRTNVINK